MSKHPGFSPSHLSNKLHQIIFIEQLCILNYFLRTSTQNRTVELKGIHILRYLIRQ